MSSRTGLLLARALALAAVPIVLPASNCAKDVGEGDEFGVHTVRVSVDAQGAQVLANSENVSVSADGRFVAFDSDAPNVAPNDSNGVRDVFVKDRTTGAVEIVSVNTAFPLFPPFWPSRNPAMTPDGRYVVFESQGSLAAGPGGDGKWRVFLHDRVLRTTKYVLGRFTDLGDDMFDARISADGAVIVFTSNSKTVPIPGGGTYSVPPVTYAPQVYAVSAAQAGGLIVDITLVSRSTGSPTTGSSNACSNPEISANGNAIVFDSSGTNLNADDVDGQTDVYRGSPAGGLLDLVTLISPGVKAVGLSGFPTVSADGNLVAFSTTASNVVPGAASATRQIAMKNMTTGAFTHVSVDDTGAPANSGCIDPHMTPDGGLVAFNTIATNLAGPGAATSDQIVVRDLLGGTVHASVGSSGAAADSFCLGSFLSADGRWVGWYSGASNLVAGDTNGGNDVFVRGPLR